MVKPMICFAPDIWGYEYSHTVEKVHFNFCKLIRCLNKKNADFSALSEFGRYPIAVSYML